MTAAVASVFRIRGHNRIVTFSGYHDTSTIAKRVEAWPIARKPHCVFEMTYDVIRPGRGASARPGQLVSTIAACANNRITIHFARCDEGDFAGMGSSQDVGFRGELVRRESRIEVDEDLLP